MKLDAVRKLKPLDRLVYFVREREAVRLKKEAGAPPPFTDDPILRTYRFCNVRRMDDKVSRWLLTNWYEPYRDHPNMLPAVALARLVNTPRALNEVTAFVFGSGKPSWLRIRDVLRHERTKGPVFNAAYMVRGGKAGGDKITEVVTDYVKPLSDDPSTLDPSSMERTWEAIHARYGFGSFMAGQVVADLRWAMSGTWTDRNDWAPVGPGSARGLARTLYGDDWVSAAKGYVGRDAEGFLQDLRAVRAKAERALPKSITSRLEMHDWQNICCEVDKMTRVINGEGKPKQLYKAPS